MEGLYFLSGLKGMNILPVSQHNVKVDSKVPNVLDSSSMESSAGCQPRPRQPHASGKRKKADAGSVSTPSILYAPGKNKQFNFKKLIIARGRPGGVGVPLLTLGWESRGFDSRYVGFFFVV